MKGSPLLPLLLIQARRSVAFLILSNKPTRSIIALSRSVASSLPLSKELSSSFGNNNAATIICTSSGSLASDYAIRIDAPKLVASPEHGQFDARSSDHGVYYTSTWEFHSLQQSDNHDLDTLTQWSHNPTFNSNNIISTKPPSNTITCIWEQDQNQWYLEIESKQTQANDSKIPKELVCIIARIMVQYAATYISSLNSENHFSLLHLTLPTLDGETFQEFRCSQLTATTSNEGVNDNYGDTNIGIRQLFQPLNSNYANTEIVDMVNDKGDILGSLPRPYAHTWNILHRGVGVIVTRDVSILDTEATSKPNVYVHQRTDTKRIFPSLYDMFVGGVSCRGESAELTAAREVAEELGLKGAFNYYQKEVVSDGTSTSSINRNPLSSELFQCTIGTAYNRCVVSVFAYQCLTDRESIQWQKEEVQWGEFVPYEVVEVAAALSVDRLKDDGSWPGGAARNYVGIDNAPMTEKVQVLRNEYAHQAWDTWDFVPDGLLVWEEWLKLYNKVQ